jgi:hypothetical protein
VLLRYEAIQKHREEILSGAAPFLVDFGQAWELFLPQPTMK